MTPSLRSAALLASSILVFACSSSDGTGSGNGDGSGQTPPSMLAQNLIDNDTAITLIDGTGQIYNQNLAGKPTGNQNTTVSCPVGGTVHITGTVGYDSTHGITTVNLTLAMTACKVSFVSPMGDENVALTLDGTMTETGSWNGSSYQSVNYQAMALTMTGTDQRTSYAPATISQTCPVAVTSNESNSMGSANGTICSRQFSY